MDASPVTIPFNRIVAGFELSPQNDFEARQKSIEASFDSMLADHHAHRDRQPQMSGAPKLSVSYPEAGAVKEPIRYRLVNETGIGLQVVNGKVLGLCENKEQWLRFVAAFDYLLKSYRQVFSMSSPREFNVIFDTVARLTDTRNFDILHRAVPDINPPGGIFASLGQLAATRRTSSDPQRLDLLVTVKVGMIEFIFDLEAPANEGNSLLWMKLTCRTPQEEYATDELFTLEKVSHHLTHGLQVYQALLDGFKWDLEHV